MEQQPKINLIYIGSIGHSGSTLLESILGAHSNMVTSGEIHMWPHEIMQGGVKPCICGESVLECPVWSEVRKRANPLSQPKPQIHEFREQWDAGHTVRLDRLKDFNKGELSAELTEQVNTYGQNNYNVFNAFLNVMRETYGTDLNWVIDASKDPYRLLWLARSQSFNIKVLHVVKKPPSFAYSMVKRLPKEDANLIHKRFYETSRQSLKWSIENYLITKAAANHLAPDDYKLVNYEELASDPMGAFKDICAAIGCEFEEQAVTNFRQGSQHTIAGNPMRYEGKGIVLDEKWKTNLPSYLRITSEVLTSMNRSVYGY